ncbi:MAG: N-acetyl-gamma-glutamyl-phosphate reductase [Rhizomicrobium sp.]|jgi:N-acetyl-gamma-glutamyl-phosphate reductase
MRSAGETETVKPKLFIDGAAGTTGLEIRQRLEGRDDLVPIELSESERKELAARTEALNEASLVILCLPDDAAREAVRLIENPAVRVLDASSAHRAAGNWVYGFPELEPNQRGRIAAARRVSNPGCYPTGYLALVRPLVRAGIIPPDFPLTTHAVSGYSGGGKAMIAEFEDARSAAHVDTIVRTYGLTLAHKHIAEMHAHSGLAHPPVFAPSVGRFYRGMIVEVPLQLWALPKKPNVTDLHAVLAETYNGEPLVEVAGIEETMRMKTLDAELLKLTNGMKLFVFGNDKTHQARLVAVLDNLGKGASGAAVQNLNLMLGIPETTGLT